MDIGAPRRVIVVEPEPVEPPSPVAPDRVTVPDRPARREEPELVPAGNPA